MPVTVVVGGQFGSEGKGKVGYCLARERPIAFAVRVGGSNSGHTAVDERGNIHIFRQLPTACLVNGVRSIIGSGSYIDVDVLLQEIDRYNIPTERLFIDANAVVISATHKSNETNLELGERIGSTQSGTGAAVIDRILRSADLCFARDETRFARFNVCDTRVVLREALNKGSRVIVEGTQGFGLSLLHSPHYPYVTSRDTTAAAFVSEAGLSPLDVDEVVMVIRAFPIRVGGNSGPLNDETDWDAVTVSSGYPKPLVEKTSVTGRVRRVGLFDGSIVRQAIAANNPTRIVLNHLDYIDYSCRRVDQLTNKALAFVTRVENQIGSAIDCVGWNPTYMSSLCPKISRVGG